MTSDEKTAAAIRSTYRVSEAGTIQNPGKFEGEMIYAPFFWDCAINGMEDECDTFAADDAPVSVFHLTDEDRRVWPELGGAITLSIWEDSQGFVRCITEEAE